MVRGAALSGLEALVLTTTEYARLDSTVLQNVCTEASAGSSV